MRRLLAILVLLVSSAFAADPPAPPTRIKGCTAVVGFRNLSVYYERFVVIAEKETPPDDPPEWWGFYPDRKPMLDKRWPIASREPTEGSVPASARGAHHQDEAVPMP